MANTDFIASIYATGPGLLWNNGLSVIQRNAAAHDYAPPRVKPEDAHSGVPTYYQSPSLTLSFSRAPNTTQGFVIGHDLDCDIVLPKGCGAGFRHGAITFDENYRLVYRDLGSSQGSQVTYDNGAQGWRSKFQWILSGHRVADGTQKLVVAITPNMTFQIVVHPHDIDSPVYRNMVVAFRRGTAAEPNHRPVELAHSLSKKHKGGPNNGPLCVVRPLGEGAFGVVHHFWDVSTGEEWALKEPSLRAIKTRSVRLQSWKDEARIMSQISNPHVVRLLGAEFNPIPKLRLEYLPCGPLDRQPNVTPDEAIQVLEQCLFALVDLHAHKPPIVHRDINPGNILVQDRSYGKIIVKLTDFGLTRESAELTTICGTRRYIAPEIYEEEARRCRGSHRGSYTPAVDIWSLGVVVMECYIGLPESMATEKVWCERIAETLSDDFRERPNRLLMMLLSMVAMDPRCRRSARGCTRLAHELRLFEEDDDNNMLPSPSTPTSATPSPVFGQSETGHAFHLAPKPPLGQASQGPVPTVKIWGPS